MCISRLPLMRSKGKGGSSEWRGVPLWSTRLLEPSWFIFFLPSISSPSLLPSRPPLYHKPFPLGPLTPGMDPGTLHLFNPTYAPMLVMTSIMEISHSPRATTHAFLAGLQFVFDFCTIVHTFTQSIYYHLHCFIRHSLHSLGSSRCLFFSPFFF